MNPAWWAILGIAPTDDLRLVKRAYATRLKACRPEDDPQGFAQLRGAYDAVLSRLKSAAKESVAPLGAISPEGSIDRSSAEFPDQSGAMRVHGGDHAPDPAVPVKPVTVTPPDADAKAPAPIVRPLPSTSSGHGEPLPPPVTRLTPRVNTTVAGPSPQGVARKILEEARRLDGRWSGFAIWLRNHEDLFSLDFKLATSQALLRSIAADGAPCSEAIDVLNQFFGWDDYRRLGAPTAASILINQVQQRISERNFEHWLNAGRSQDNEAARTLKTVRKLGDGKRAWMMASLLRNRSRVVKAFRAVHSTYGEAVLGTVLGEKAMAFWHRALAPMPNLLQLALTIPVGLVTSVLIATFFLVDVPDSPMWVQVPLWTLTIIATAILCIDYVGIGLRLWNVYCLPRIRRRLQALSDALKLQSVPREVWGAVVLIVLGIAGWFWPESFPDWPFYTVVLLMSLGAFKERRSIYGCALAGLGVSALFRLFLDNGKVPFLAVPATLWAGRLLHERLRQWFPRVRAKQETVVLAIGMTVGLACLVLAAWHIS